MKLETEIAAINANLRVAISRAAQGDLKTRLGGLALPYKRQDQGDPKNARTVNLFALDASPASIDDNQDLDLFHIVQTQEFGKAEIRRGRIAEQTQSTVLVLILYTVCDQALDLVKHTLAAYPGAELRRVELAPDLVNEKYLFLEKQPNATTPRQLAAITYSLTAWVPLGGDRCPSFALAGLPIRDVR